MKFEEVKQALETGKKITRKTFNGKNLVKSPLMSIATFENSIAEYKFSYIDIIIADDWEIIEDPLKATIKTKTIRYITCPNCKKDLELTDIHVYRRYCGFCGKNIEFEEEKVKSIKDLLTEASLNFQFTQPVIKFMK